MNADQEKEYVFYLEWEDAEKESFKVGFLAEINKMFYFVISKKQSAELAYNKGFVGIPGFNPGEIYYSSELFDFFERRVLDKKGINPCTELAKTQGRSLVDSFYLEEVPMEKSDQYKKLIIDIVEMQQRKKIKDMKKRKIMQEKNDRII